VGDEALARAVALAMVGMFLAYHALSFVNPNRPVPAELYPPVSLALGYLLGHRFLRGDGNGEKK